MNRRYMKKIWYDIVNNEKEKKCEIYLYGVIGSDGVSASQFISDLKQQKDFSKMDIHINSPGGEVFDGIAIYNTLKDSDFDITVYIDGLAASIASVVAMAGDKIVMYDTASLMIHKPWTLSIGNATQLRGDADVLDLIEANIMKAYRSRAVKISESELSALMSAETWMDSEEAKKYGFIDETIKDDSEKKDDRVKDVIDAKIFSKFKNVPDKFKNLISKKDSEIEFDKIKETLDTLTKGVKFMFDDALTTKKEDVGMTPEKMKELQAKASNGDSEAIKELDSYYGALGVRNPYIKTEEEIRNHALKEERERIQEIKSLGEITKAKAETIEKAINDGISISEASKIFTAEIRNSLSTKGVIVDIKVGMEDSEKFLNMCKSSLDDVSGIEKDNSKRAEIKKSGAPRSILSLARRCLEREGKSNVSSMSNEDVARKILNATTQGTGDFTNILTDAVNKNIAMGMQEAPTTYKFWTKTVPVVDFKTYNHVAMSNFSDVEVINEGEKFQFGAFSDKKETGNVTTKGKAYTISRQAIVNDDLGAFTRIPQAIGASIERRINGTCYELLYSNSLVGPAMTEDGLYLFDATATTGHGNYIASGSGAVPSSTTLDAGRKAMMTRKLLAPEAVSSAQYTGVPPRYILSGPSLQTTIEQLVYTGFLIAGSTTAAQTGIYNPYGPEGKNQLLPIIEPYLLNSDSARDTGWYLIANQSQIDTFILLTLNGESSPTLRQENSRISEALGVTWDIYFDWGWMAGDWRGMYYNNGD